MAKSKESPQEQVEDPKVEEEDSKAKPEDSEQPEFEALDDEQAIKAVGDLIKEPTEEEPQEEPEKVTPAEEEVQVPIVDDELIKQYPVLRAYYGKPVTDIAHGYQSIVTQFMNKSNDFAEMKRKLDNMSLQKTDDIPDMVEKPEEFKKWKENFAKANQELGAGQSQKPQIDLIGELTQRLPQGTDVNDVVNKWANKNAYKLFDGMGNLRPEMQSLYIGNPEVLYQEVSEFLKNDEKENDDEAKVRKAGHKKLQSDFKKARKSKKDMPNANVQAVPRDVELTEEEEMLIRIGQLVQEE